MGGGNSDEPFLIDKIEDYDALKVFVVASLAQQSLRVKVEKIYSEGKGAKRYELGSEIEYVHAPETWGNECLEIGQRAIVFLSEISGRLYEAPWRGHLTIEAINGESYAIFQHRELWLDKAVPLNIRESSRQDPRRSYTTAIKFDVLEVYLSDVIDRVGRMPW